MKGAIERAVIHQHNFETFAVRFHYRFEAIVQIGYVLLLVMERDYN